MHTHGNATRLVRNTVANFAGQGISVLLVFFSVPFIAHRLGSNLYGYFVLLMTFLGALHLLNLGINTTLVKYIGELLPQGEFREIEFYLGTSLTVFLGCGLVVAVPVCLGAPWMATHLLSESKRIDPILVVCFRIAGGAFFLRFVSQALSATTFGVQRFDLVNLINCGVETGRTLGSIAILYFSSYSLPGVMAITVAADLASCGAYFVAGRALLPAVHLRPMLSRPHLRSLVQFSKFVLIGNVSSRLVNSADNFLIAYFMPLSNVAFYGVPYAIGQKLWTVVGNVASTVFPAASGFFGAGDRQQLSELYLRGSKATVALVCFPALALCILGRVFLVYWMSPEFAEKSAIVLRLLSLGFLLNASALVSYLFLQATRFPDIAARFSGIYAAVNVSLFVILIPRFGIGGAAAGFVAAQILVLPWMVRTTNRLLGLDCKSFLRAAWLPAVPALLLASMALLALLPWATSLLRVCAAGAAGLLVYALLGWFTVLDGRERRACRSSLEVSELLLVFRRRRGRPSSTVR